MDLGGCRNYLTARGKKILRSQGGPTPKNCAFLGQFRQKILFIFMQKKNLVFANFTLFWGLRAGFPSDLYVFGVSEGSPESMH